MQTTSWGERASDVSDPPSTDGRTARRDRNRTAVLDAAIELFSEGQLSPGVHDVAARSGVSLRSVYRYFDDLDSLISAAIRRQYELSKPYFSMPRLGEGPLPDRIERFCRARVGLFERVRTVFAAATVRARVDEQVAHGLEWTRGRLSEQTQAMFAPELETLPEHDAQMMLLTIDVLTQFETIELLRGTRSLSEGETARYLEDTFAEILG